MDRDSRSSESREPVLSAEPSSTRPNPFYGDDENESSARKRRRTSPSSASPSRSVETLKSQDDPIAVSAASAASAPSAASASASDSKMKIDSPETPPSGPAAAPSTPPRPGPPPTEPVSSRVTLNLRNVDGLDATPASPVSPTKLPTDNVKVSIEESERDMTQTMASREASPSPSPKSKLGSGSPELPIASIENGDDEIATMHDASESIVFDAGHAAQLAAHLADFPYRNYGEAAHDPIRRLIHYFQHESGNLEEILRNIHSWISTVADYAHVEFYSVVMETYIENRAFWQLLPELFISMFKRLGRPRTGAGRELVYKIYTSVAKVAGVMVSIDCRTVDQSIEMNDPCAPELLSPGFIAFTAEAIWDETPNTALTTDIHDDAIKLLNAFQPRRGGYLVDVNRLVKLQANLAARFPRKVTDFLHRSSRLAYSTTMHICHDIPYPMPPGHSVDSRSRANLECALEFFNIGSAIVNSVVDKSSNHLSPDTTPGLVYHLAYIINLALKNGAEAELPEVQTLLQDHRQKHPEVSPNFTGSAIYHEWQLGIWGRLVRSQQMQIRVTAASCMCSDLINLWKRYQESLSKGESDTPERLKLFQHLSNFIVKTGIIDYILGPTCHPEITVESANIVGFLVVTRTYSPAHTDLWWQTVSSTQDPRISDALVRMMLKILHLLDMDDLSYICGKLSTLPIDAFTATMRDFCEKIILGCLNKQHGLNTTLPTVIYKLLLRLLQESSTYTQQGSIAFQDIQTYAAHKLREVLHTSANSSARHEVFKNCIQDITNKSRTSSGSLLALSFLTGPTMQIADLISDHDFTRLLIDDLASILATANADGIAPIYAHPINDARRKFISKIITDYAPTIDSELGQKLWDLLIGTAVTCQEDRRAAWEDLIDIQRIRPDNPFLETCLREYMPRLPPSCYCAGCLEFVREFVVNRANAPAPNAIILDDERSLRSSGIELLWQIILTAPPHTIEDRAINTLVKEVYVNSKSIMSFPLDRARRVHFSLARQCLQQLKLSAQKLKAFSEGTMSGDDEPMVIVATDEQQQEQELQFARSLKVLNMLLMTLQTRPSFAAPDLRSLMLQSPSSVVGEPAGLKYQSFDEDSQSDVQTLSIGLRNTLPCLLTNVQAATGFENFRLYHRGKPITPLEADICKTVHELGICGGLILVRKEEGMAPCPAHIKPGASSLDIEILSHFKDLWEYLSMEETLAREIYQFLIRLPADESMLAVIEEPDTTYSDVFPSGQTLKSLYALHALREYLSTQKLKTTVSQIITQNSGEQKIFATADHEKALTKGITLIVAAICDPGLVGNCSDDDLQMQLALQLVDDYVQLLKESVSISAVSQLLSSDLQSRLLEILTSALSAPSSQFSLELTCRSFEAMIESCVKSKEFWEGFRSTNGVLDAIRELLVDPRLVVRRSVTKLISNKCVYNHGPSGVHAVDFAEMFWPIAWELLPQAVASPSQCEEVMSLCIQLLEKLVEADSPKVDLSACLAECGKLLVAHTSTEDITHPERVDVIAHGLIRILFHGTRYTGAKGKNIPFTPGLARRLLTRHLFPPEDVEGPLVPQAVLHPPSRSMFYEFIHVLLKNDPSQLVGLLRNLDALTTYRRTEEDDPYLYELPHSFDRSRAIRSPCGYAGLRNLSNTCYLNSLFTQLFMNVGFRRFMLNLRVPNSEAHRLLGETQSLFAALQDSRRRFVDTQLCVSQIVTYDETPLDIHNQMDVDEFYNLLFDRWEAQMPSEYAKRMLRSFYGGRLVQQVKSKECEHISERIEPFSAIQCDIKGKSNLEESLQAYVDGEIMEGENKYKCSDCDKHVDAVKRACLRDIPDNLIFHLKRFDFNLKTLQRSKINDCFAFPTKIDMQPYTIEHLSGATSGDTDMFELVGILVHSGTAETGHYYSFIRERPILNDRESWVEFNDDFVGPWDPARISNACFGGTEQRPHFEGGGSYEKANSAYMLFYQRSSALGDERELLRTSGATGPLRCDLPSRLEAQIKEENWGIVQRHCLHDQSHIPFVHKILSYAWGPKCSDDHKVQNLAMQVALGHLDQVASRAKDLTDFDILVRFLNVACQRCPRCSVAFFEYLSARPEALRNLLQRNPEATVRQETARMLITVLSIIKSQYPEAYGVPKSKDDEDPYRLEGHDGTIIMKTMELFLKLWETFHSTLRSWPEYFGSLAAFAQLGRLEAAALLEHDFLAKTLLIITADPALDLPPQYAKLLNVMSRRLATRPPNYENVINLIDTLLSVMDHRLDQSLFFEQSSGRFALASGGAIPFAAHEVNILHRDWTRSQASIFLEKLIQINQNPVKTNSILRRLMSLGPIMDRMVFATLKAGITGHIVQYMMFPYLRLAVVYCHLCASPDRTCALIQHVSNQSRILQNGEGRSFFEFQRDVFVDHTDEKALPLHIQSLYNIAEWAPGLLGYIDRNVSHDVEMFLQEKLFSHGPSPVFGESNGGLERSNAMDEAARKLAFSCLEYLRDTYVCRGAQAARDTVFPLEKVINACDPYFDSGEFAGNDLISQYRELRDTVLRSMEGLVVDEIEEDGSEWENSPVSSEQMDSLADINMQAEHDIYDGQ